MRHSIALPLLLLSACTQVALLIACIPAAPAETPPEVYFDDWRIELEAEFPMEADGSSIDLLRIGGELFNNNFANRGDVMVLFEETDTITVELRRFALASDLELAEADFAKLTLWSFLGPSRRGPARPDDMVVSRPCVADGMLRNECALLAFYDGAIQPLGVGVDMRVTLPSSYRGRVVIATEDDALGLRRSNVCLGPNTAAVDVAMGRGLAFVSLDPDLAATTGTTGPGSCQSSVACASVRGESPDVTIDVPADAYSLLTANLEYGERGQENCELAWDLEGIEVLSGNGTAERGWVTFAAGPMPRPPVLGIEASVRNEHCAWVQTGEANLGEQGVPSVLRGNIEFCHGCSPPPECG